MNALEPKNPKNDLKIKVTSAPIEVNPEVVCLNQGHRRVEVDLLCLTMTSVLMIAFWIDLHERRSDLEFFDQIHQPSPVPLKAISKNPAAAEGANYNGP